MFHSKTVILNLDKEVRSTFAHSFIPSLETVQNVTSYNFFFKSKTTATAAATTTTTSTKPRTLEVQAVVGTVAHSIR